MTRSFNFKVTLLGIGTPIRSRDRFGPCTLVEAGDQKLLIDAGRGAAIRLSQPSIPIGRIGALFLTISIPTIPVGVPDIWLTGWLVSFFGTRQTPFRVISPGGTKSLMLGLACSCGKSRSCLA
jgi:ribonuclease Z